MRPRRRCAVWMCCLPRNAINCWWNGMPPRPSIWRPMRSRIVRSAGGQDSWPIAVAHEDRQLSYGALNARANRLARYLRGLSAGPDARVALCMERSLEMIVGLLAILKAGGAYVPLDPTYPGQSGWLYMVGRAGSGRKPPHRGSWPSAVYNPFKSMQLGPLSQSTGRRLRCATTETGHQPGSGGVRVNAWPNLAYVIYTSGSTGHPKGAMVRTSKSSRLFSATAAWYWL